MSAILSTRQGQGQVTSRSVQAVLKHVFFSYLKRGDTYRNLASELLDKYPHLVEDLGILREEGLVSRVSIVCQWSAPSGLSSVNKHLPANVVTLSCVQCFSLRDPEKRCIR